MSDKAGYTTLLYFAAGKVFDCERHEKRPYPLTVWSLLLFKIKMEMVKITWKDMTMACL